jgi:uncharacterized protein YndB with AHSA1/START domain
MIDRGFSAGASALIALFAAPSAEAAARSQSTIVIDAPIDRIWSLVVDVDRWPSWNKAVQSARLDGDVAPGSVFKWTSGGFGVTSTFRTVQPMTHLSWTCVAFGAHAVHSWLFEPTARGVKVTTTETFDGWMPRLMPRTMQKMLDDTLPKLLASLKRAAEQQG